MYCRFCVTTDILTFWHSSDLRARIFLRTPSKNYFKQDRQFGYNGMTRRVRVTTVALEKQWVLNIVSVATVILHAMRMLRIALSSAAFLTVLTLLGAFAKLRKATSSVVMSVRPSVRPYVCLSIRPSARKTQLSLDGCSWKLIFQYFSKICLKNQVSLKSDKNNRHCTWNQYKYFIISRLYCSESEKCFRQKL
jgi:hypothetical protein